MWKAAVSWLREEAARGSCVEAVWSCGGLWRCGGVEVRKCVWGGVEAVGGLELLSGRLWVDWIWVRNPVGKISWRSGSEGGRSLKGHLDLRENHDTGLFPNSETSSKFKGERKVRLSVRLFFSHLFPLFSPAALVPPPLPLDFILQGPRGH